MPKQEKVVEECERTPRIQLSPTIMEGGSIYMAALDTAGEKDSLEMGFLKEMNQD